MNNTNWTVSLNGILPVCKEYNDQKAIVYSDSIPRKRRWGKLSWPHSPENQLQWTLNCIYWIFIQNISQSLLFNNLIQGSPQTENSNCSKLWWDHHSGSSLQCNLKKCVNQNPPGLSGGRGISSRGDFNCLIDSWEGRTTWRENHSHPDPHFL